jgi:hypothetical protein
VAAFVANEGSGSVSLLATGASETSVAGRLDFGFDRFARNGFDPSWTSVRVQFPASEDAAALRTSSVRIQGLLPVDTLVAPSIGDSDQDGVTDVTVRVRRSRLPSVLATGDSTIVRVTGVMDSVAGRPSRRFVVTDTVRVQWAAITSPLAGQSVTGSAPHAVQWQVRPEASAAAMWSSADAGRTWALVADSLPNTGQYAWTPPGTSHDSMQVAVLQVRARHPGGVVEGACAVGYSRVSPAVAFWRCRGADPARRAATVRFGCR